MTGGDGVGGLGLGDERDRAAARGQVIEGAQQPLVACVVQHEAVKLQVFSIRRVPSLLAAASHNTYLLLRARSASPL